MGWTVGTSFAGGGVTTYFLITTNTSAPTRTAIEVAVTTRLARDRGGGSGALAALTDDGAADGRLRGATAGTTGSGGGATRRIWRSPALADATGSGRFATTFPTTGADGSDSGSLSAKCNSVARAKRRRPCWRR